ncbi:MAG: rhodanese-like domain-containing protein [Gammaproteobacteria bacterium]|nr:rhodanese-like domain-containing protein [Gammaproteobacteria bacterium]
MELKRIILEACVLVAFAALFGLTLNHQLVMDAFSGQLVPQRDDGDTHIESLLPVPALLDEVQQALAGDGLVVDARSPELFADGHIKGAVSLPLVEIDTALPDFLERTPRDRTIVAYCSGFGCPDSFDLGVLLIEEGYTDVRVFEGGYPEWRDAGLPVEEGGL